MVLIFQSLLLIQETGYRYGETQNSLPKNPKTIEAEVEGNSCLTQSIHRRSSNTCQVSKVSKGQPLETSVWVWASMFLNLRREAHLLADTSALGGWIGPTTACLEYLLPLKQRYNRTKQKQRRFRNRWTPSFKCFQICACSESLPATFLTNSSSKLLYTYFCLQAEWQLLDLSIGLGRT